MLLHLFAEVIHDTSGATESQKERAAGEDATGSEQ